ncbi:universal stress protein [Nocardia cyriacigeorgica]|uniref:Universal stress protein n=1 Tax=Nocardia cyriacigeorgica TaxID=135487 RepID=A0ABX0CNN1_9NOCA|nr:universal stress protein [Nocardia cyriacigeorgica]NEW58003.1 universal stress protein [Nocardia cyriacigeorgica]
MTTTGAPVVVGADGSPSAFRAVRWAAADAARHGSPLHIVYAIGVPVDVGPALGYAPIDAETYRKAGEDALAEACDIAVVAAAPIGDIEIETWVREAAPVPLLRDRSASARLLVVGTRGLGALRRGLLGSVSTSLARHAHCPVAIIPDSAERGDGPVVVGTDCSPTSIRAIDIAFDQAARRDTELVAVLAWSEFYRYLSRPELEAEALTRLTETLAPLSARHPEVPVRCIVAEDRPARLLLSTATDAQLLVVGSHGHGGFVGMTLGSVSQAVLHAADCPVIIARAAS